MVHFLEICLFLSVFGFTRTREPQCSNFDFQEKLLEKAVRSEIKMETIEASLEKLSKKSEREYQLMRDAVTELRSGSVAQPHSVSSVYIRWGRTSCPANDTDVVYSGVIGGGRYDETGSTSNYLCLPNQPLWAPDTTSQSTYVSHMYGAEYETHTAPQLSKLHNQEAPCVVCRLRGRNTLMIPARNVCFPGWRREYAGFLMAMYYNHKGNKNAICVDAEAEITENSNDANQDGALMYFVQAKCGSLKCPPYEEKRLLTCVVCSI